MAATVYNFPDMKIFASQPRKNPHAKETLLLLSLLLSLLTFGHFGCLIIRAYFVIRLNGKFIQQLLFSTFTTVYSTAGK